jgi:hypothetical protein
MAAYAEHVLISTGKDDWTSRIEEEAGAGNIAQSLKGLLGRGGKFCDVCVFTYPSFASDEVSDS